MAVENNKEFISQSSFKEILSKLSSISNPEPLKPENINLIDLRNQLICSGINLDLINSNPELKTSIQKSQFRNFDSGRGPAVVAALGGIDNANRYSEWAIAESVNQPLLSKGDESSKSRGLMQFIADTIALANSDVSVDDYCKKTNWRVGKKYQKDENLSQKFQLPTDPVGQQKLKETSSIPKGSALRAYEFILSLNK